MSETKPLPEALVTLMVERQKDIEFGYKKYETGYVMTDEQLATLKVALGLSNKDKDYRPYCLACQTMPRVFIHKDGFECPHCHNRFGFDLIKLP